MISVRAVALANTSLTGQACVVALDPNSETSVTTSGATALNFPGCSLYVNSPYAKLADDDRRRDDPRQRGLSGR